MIYNALRHIKRLLPLGLLAASILCGCSDSDAPLSSAEEQDDGAITVVLRVPTDGSDVISRADPMPGEDGNGREQGILNENTIYDVNILFYVGDGLNPANASSIGLSGVYISDMSSEQVSAQELPFEKVYTIRLSPSDLSKGPEDILLAYSTVSFVTIANAGRDLRGEFTSLADLRSYCFGASWTAKSGSRSAADCDRFVMTTAYDAATDGNLNIEGKLCRIGSNRLNKVAHPATDDDPKWVGETTVQRICARIDLMYAEANIAAGENANSINGLKYTVEGTDNVVHLTNALPVNVMQKPSYLLTKVTAGIPAAWTDDAALGAIKWGGVEECAGTPLAPTNYVIDPRTLLKEGEVADADIALWYGDSRAAAVTTDIADSKGPLSEYYSGTLPATETRYGCTRHTILGYANENVQSPAQFKSKYITGIVLRAVYQPGSWVRLNGGEYVTETLTDAEWEDLTDKSFTRYMPTAGGANAITDSQAKYFASDADAQSYSAAHPEDQAVLTRFDGGVCYYNLWLRHYNDESADSQQAYPMEYAIVRNNIYRVALTFSGVGNPTPDLRAPDTMMARIFVRKWNVRKENQPLEF